MKMSSEKLLETLRAMDNTENYGNHYFVVENTSENIDILDMIGEEYKADSVKNGVDVTVVQIRGYESEEDVYSTLCYCECYAGQ